MLCLPYHAGPGSPFFILGLCQLGSLEVHKVIPFFKVSCKEGYRPSLMAGTFSGNKLLICQGLESQAISLALRKCSKFKEKGKGEL